MLLVLCPFCESMIVGPRAPAGATITCPDCERTFIVPKANLSEEELKRYLRKVKGEK